MKLSWKRTALGFRELDLYIDSVLPLSGRAQIIFVTRTLFYKKKEKKKENLETSRKLHCLMLDGSMYKRNQSKKAFKCHFRIKVRLFSFFFFNSCISGILGKKNKNWQRNRKKKSCD